MALRCWQSGTCSLSVQAQNPSQLLTSRPPTRGASCLLSVRRQPHAPSNRNAWLISLGQTCPALYPLQLTQFLRSTGATLQNSLSCKGVQVPTPHLTATRAARHAARKHALAFFNREGFHQPPAASNFQVNVEKKKGKKRKWKYQRGSCSFMYLRGR
jgi:hypothetical protein